MKRVNVTKMVKMWQSWNSTLKLLSRAIPKIGFMILFWEEHSTLDVGMLGQQLKGSCERLKNEKTEKAENTEKSRVMI